MEKREVEQKEKIELDKDVKTIFTAFKIIVLVACLMLIFSTISSVMIYVRGQDWQTSDVVYGFYNDNHFNSTNVVFDEAFNIRNISDGLTEVDKWEFALQSPDVLNPVGLDDPNTWTDIEQTGDSVNIFAQSTNDRVIRMQHATDNYYGLEKTNFLSDPFTGQDAEIVNVSVNFMFESVLPVSVGNATIKIYSDDSTLVAFINVFIDGGFASGTEAYILQYFDGSNYVDLTTGNSWFDDNQYYEYNVFVNYTDDTCILYYQNATDYQQWSFPLITTGKDGLQEVEFRGVGIGLLAMRIDSIGVYCNDSSQSNEHAWKSVQLPSNWNLEYNNLFTARMFGYGMLNITNGFYQVGVSTLDDLLQWTFYLLNESERYNIYHLYTGNIASPYIIMYQVNYFLFGVWFDTRNFKMYEVSIDGVKVIDRFDAVVRLDYTYALDDLFIMENFFYCDNTVNTTDTKLYYELHPHTSSLEYIQAGFNTAPVMTTNRTFKFVATINPLFVNMFCEGAVYLNFRGGTSYGLTFDSYKRYNQVIPQKLEILDFYILISDNDNDWASGNAVSGYVSEITLVFSPNIGISILTINILSMLAPLIIMTAPTLAFYKRMNNNKKVIVPMLMLMSIICVATNLIPFWMFFVLLLCFSAYLIHQFRKKE